MADSANTSVRKSGALKRTGNTGKLISSYFLEIEYLIERVTGSSTYYQTLGLEQAANNEAIVHAYQKAVKLLHHPNRKVRAALTDELQDRIDQAFNKASEAFVVLTDLSKRKEYDLSLTRRTSADRFSVINQRPLIPPPSNGTPFGATKPARSSEPQEVSGSGRLRSKSREKTIERVRSVSGPVKADVQPARENRRRADRIQLAIPTLVLGHDRSDGSWKEVTKTFDVSRNGAGILVNRRVKHGTVLLLRLPMPAKLRCHGYADPGYKVYAIVRRVELPVDGVRMVGVEFLGEQAPPGYLEKPWSVYRSKPWSGPDRRREPRYRRSEPITIEYLDDSMNPIKRHRATLEDLSRSGMRLILAPGAPEVSLVKVITSDDSFASVAAVRNRFFDDDGHERLCLKLINNTWPWPL